MKVGKSDWGTALYVDSFATIELVFPQASVIGLTLHDSTAQPGEAGHQDQPFRFRMSSTRARGLAQALIESADTLDGKGQRRQ